MLDTYSSLKDAVAGSAGQSWSHRNDVLSRFDDFLLLAEEEIFRHLRIRDQEIRSTASLSTSTRFLALPDDFLEIRRMELEHSDSIYPLQFVTAGTLVEMVDVGRPQRFTVTSQFEFDRLPDVAYTAELQYFGKLTGLSSANPTNALLTRFPSVYLYSCLAQLWIWAMDIEKSTAFILQSMDAIKEANRQDNDGRYGPNPQAIYRGAVV